MIVHNTQRSTALSEAISRVLKELGLNYDSVVMLIRVPDVASESGFRILGTATGDPEVFAIMMFEQLRHMISDPVTIYPVDGSPTPPIRVN